MALHLDTGVPAVDAEDDFTRARRRYELDRLDGWLRREAGQTQLLRFDEVVSALGFRGEYYLGPRTIRLDTVVGTVEDTRGRHRVSVAIATGQVMIDADVTQVLTQLPATALSRHGNLMRPGLSPRIPAGGADAR